MGDATLIGDGMAPKKQHHHGTKMTFKMANAHFQASRLQAGDNAAASGMSLHFLEDGRVVQEQEWIGLNMHGSSRIASSRIEASSFF